MKVTQIDYIKDHNKAAGMIKSGKIKTNDVVIIWLETGSAWLRPVVVEGSYMMDLIDLLDSVYYTYDNDDMPFPLYTLEEVEEYMGDINYIPINGGEYYTDPVHYIDYVEGEI